MNKLILGNWKMYKNLSEAKIFFDHLSKNDQNKMKCQWGIIPSAPLIYPLASYLDENALNWLNNLGLQDFFPAYEGAYTGENSLKNFEGLKLNYLLVGHSERRTIFNETEEFVKDKLFFGLQNNKEAEIVFIFGETKSERKEKTIEELVEAKILSTFKEINTSDLKRIIIAYEPLWSIGTGKLPSLLEIESVFRIIKKILAKLFSKEEVEEIRIIYGGSINEQNYKSILDSDLVDGLLIGGASLDPQKFIKIINHE